MEGSAALRRKARSNCRTKDGSTVRAWAMARLVGLVIQLLRPLKLVGKLMRYSARSGEQQRRAGGRETAGEIEEKEERGDTRRSRRELVAVCASGTEHQRSTPVGHQRDDSARRTSS